MRILITGGCGFIGSHFVNFHLEKGDEVIAVDDLSTGTLENILPFQSNPAFRFYQADLLTWSGLQEAVDWAEFIYHFAAVVGVFRALTEPLKVMQTNVLGCERVLKAVSQTSSKPHVIIASSSSVYGANTELLLNENDNLIIKSAGNPLKLYAISKITDEALGIAYHHTFKMPITIIRLFNIIGPRQTGLYGMVVPRFINQACQNEPITVFGDGTQTRSFCDIRDVILALELLTKNKESNCQIVNIGDAREIQIKDLAELIRKRANSHSEIKYISYQEAYGLEFSDIPQRRPDLSKLYELTDYKPQWSLEKTINDLIALERL